MVVILFLQGRGSSEDRGNYPESGQVILRTVLYDQLRFPTSKRNREVNLTLILLFHSSATAIVVVDTKIAETSVLLKMEEGDLVTTIIIIIAMDGSKIMAIMIILVIEVGDITEDEVVAIDTTTREIAIDIIITMEVTMAATGKTTSVHLKISVTTRILSGDVTVMAILMTETMGKPEQYGRVLTKTRSMCSYWNLPSKNGK